jgi:hypothetical protein
MVLDDFFDGPTREPAINVFLTTNDQDQELQDGLDDGTQDPYSDG